MTREKLLLPAACAAVAVTMLDTTVVTVALPNLQEHSTVGVGDLQWIVNSYLVVFTALTLAGGVLADRYGRCRLLVVGLLVFAAGSALTGLGHPTGGWDALRAGRIIQGVGAAMSEPATLAVLRDRYDAGPARARALGVWAATAGMAIALGPVLGGLLVALGGWRAVFIANLPLALVALALVVVAVPAGAVPAGAVPAGAVPAGAVPAGVASAGVASTGVAPSSGQARSRLDLGGLLLGVVALFGLSFGLIQEQSDGFGSPTVIGALGAAVLAAIALVAVERRAADPAIPLDIAAGRSTLAANLGALTASFAIFAVFFFVTIDLQTVGGVSAFGTAGAFAPMVGFLVGGALLAGRLCARLPPQRILATGLALSAAGIAVTGLAITSTPTVGALIAPLVVVGAGLGLTLAPATIIVLGAVPPARAGVAAATVNLARQLGGLLAVAVLGAVTIRRLTSALVTELDKYHLYFARSQVFDDVTHPGNGALGKPSGAAFDPNGRSYADIVAQATHAAEAAFTSGLHLALAVTVAVLGVAALVALVVRPRQSIVRSPTGGDDH